jgi:hypothetical protein
MHTGVQNDVFVKKVLSLNDIMAKPDVTGKPFLSASNLVNGDQGNLGPDGNQL